MAFTKQDYLELRSALNFQARLAPTLAVVAFDVALLLAAGALLRHGGALAFIVSQLALALVFFNSFGLLHECGHGTASRFPLVNTIIGHWASTFAFIPYFPWKYIHQKHHLWTGNMDEDPVLKSPRTFRDRGVPKLAAISWRTWIPISAFLQHVVFLTYPIVMWRADEMNLGRLIRSVISVLWLPVSLWGLWRLWPDIVRPTNVALAICIHLIAEEVVNLPHHVDMPTFKGKIPVWEQYRATRSCYYPLGLSELFVLNFNFHVEHHLLPDLPWYRLRRARTLVKATLGGNYQECVGISWNIQNRKRDLDAIVQRYRVEPAQEVA